jgi:hypothetical protein
MFRKQDTAAAVTIFLVHSVALNLLPKDRPKLPLKIFLSIPTTTRLKIASVLTRVNKSVSSHNLKFRARKTISNSFDTGNNEKSCQPKLRAAG